MIKVLYLISNVFRFYMDGQCLTNYQQNGFKWVEKSRLSRFNEIFIKHFDENSDKGYFL